MGMDVYGKNETYFRANVWSWRAIVAACENALGEVLPFDWSFNDGAGYETQAQCDALAKALHEIYRNENPDLKIEMDSDMRVDENGHFLRTTDRTIGHSAYSTSVDHILEFATFLKNCGGGFKIH